jgi:hypothetical protein
VAKKSKPRRANPIVNEQPRRPSPIINEQSRRANPIVNEQTRRHSLRLTPTVKKLKSRPTLNEIIPKWRKVENDSDDEDSSTDSDNDDDDYDELLARHQRLVLEEQKDRKLYERYIRDQRTLRRLRCRRTHTAHLTESTRNRLLRELERERRDVIHEKICTYLADRTIIFRHGYTKESRQPMNWTTLEEELPHNRNIGIIHELDVMIGNLKKVMRNSNTSISKPRLSVRERQNQRLASVTPVTPTKSDVSYVTEIHSSPVISNPTLNLPSQLSIVSYSPRVPLVRFIDDPNSKLRPSNHQRLTCIQNVLSHRNNSQSHHNNHQTRITTNEISTPTASRKSFLRSKSTHVNSSDSSSTKKRPLEKENCSVLTSSSSNNSHSDIVLRTTSPMVSVKHTTSSSSSRSYPNTRKHPMMNNSFTTRRQTRLSKFN